MKAEYKQFEQIFQDQDHDQEQIYGHSFEVTGNLTTGFKDASIVG